MIINKIIKNLRNYDEDIALGLAGGLAVGLAGGLAWGLAWGLAFGLAGGLVVGLAGGLAVGLAFGLAVGLAVGLAFGLAVGLGVGLVNIFQLINMPFWILGLLILIIIEILFILDNKKPKKRDNKLWFTTKRKVEALLETLLIVINILNINWVIRNIDWQKYFPHIIKWLGYISITIISITIIIGLGYGYIWLNSLKYK